MGGVQGRRPGAGRQRRLEQLAVRGVAAVVEAHELGRRLGDRRVGDVRGGDGGGDAFGDRLAHPRRARIDVADAVPAHRG